LHSEISQGDIFIFIVKFTIISVGVIFFSPSGISEREIERERIQSFKANLNTNRITALPHIGLLGN